MTQAIPWTIRTRKSGRFWTGEAFVRSPTRAKRYATRKAAIGELHLARAKCNGEQVDVSGNLEKY